MSSRNGLGAALVAAALLLAAPATAAPQSLLVRPPDMGGTWVGDPGVLHFHFMHRFDATPPPTRKVLNTPTFLLGAGLPHGFLLGARYATNSLVRSGFPNEWEFFGRWTADGAGDGSSEHAPRWAVHAGWNQASSSLDAELAGSARIAGVRLLAALRGFSSPYDASDARAAAAAGVVVPLAPWLALSADFASLLDRASHEEVAWGGGLQLRIPSTPHTLSLHASNVVTTTLEGASRGGDATRWGFEFTVPVTLRRYFGGGSPAPRVASGSATDTVAVEVGMTNRLVFEPETVTIRVGQSVRWVNGSDVDHTVTADPTQARRAESVALPRGAATFDSGNMRPGDTFTHRFDVAGTYRYFCVPHELAGMVGTVVVEP